MSNDVVKLNCPACDRRLKIAQSSISKAIVCPRCDTRFRIDEQSNTLELEGQNDLFGPPISNEVSKSGLTENPFENIDHLVTSSSADSNQSTGRPSPNRPSRESANPARLPSVAEAWNQEENVITKHDDSLQRNGIGLLIMATGLSLMPFFAGNVDSLRSILPYIPFLALASAFIGSFMIAYSIRRGNIGAILVSGLPFLLIGAISLSGHFLVTLNINDARSVFDETIEEQPADDKLQVQIEAPNNDRFSIDRESLVNNAASKFVPPRQVDDRVTHQGSENNREDGIKPVSKNSERELIARSALRPDRVLIPPTTDKPNVENQSLTKEIAFASHNASNADKLNILNDRMNHDLVRGLVSRETIKSPRLLSNRFQLSDVVGQETVYGISYFAYQPVIGFDTAHFENSVDRWIDLIVPAVANAEFKDSVIAAIGFKFVGINANLDERGIIGLQGVFENEKNQERSLSEWVGIPPANNRYETLISRQGDIFGFVIYRDKRTAVGVRIVEKKQAEPGG